MARIGSPAFPAGRLVFGARSGQAMMEDAPVAVFSKEDQFRELPGKRAPQPMLPTAKNIRTGAPESPLRAQSATSCGGTWNFARWKRMKAALAQLESWNSGDRFDARRK